MSATIRLRERVHQVWLELDYDGLRPPTGLLADLELVGWRPPSPAPPPAEAIDWSRPDPVAGTRCTVLPYRVTAARVEAPSGSGPRGTLTAGEWSAHRATLDRVLARHGLSLEGGERAVPRAGSTPRPAGRPRRRGGSVVAGLPPVRGLAPDGRASEVEVVVPMGAVAACVQILEARGGPVEASPATLTIEGSYRGTSFTDEVPARRLRSLVPGPEVGAVVQALASALGIRRLDSSRLVVRTPLDTTPPEAGDHLRAVS